jgi:hypothetical protein
MNGHILLECHLPTAYLCRIISNHPFRAHTDGADNSTLHTHSTLSLQHTHTQTHIGTSYCRRIVQLQKKTMTYCKILHTHCTKYVPTFEIVY